MIYLDSLDKCWLGLFLILFVVTMSPASSFFQVKPAMAATLTGVSIHPTSNTINESATYNIFLKTATAGTIKKIVMTFPSSFNLISANKVIERNGIDPGSLSVSGSTLTYTVTTAVSVPIGRIIRLEIASITPGAAGNFTVSIKTLDSAGATIDGPTPSSAFTIKSITGNDISTGFMIRKTLNDDNAGFSKGWQPNGVFTVFSIKDPDVSGSPDSTFISVQVPTISRVTICYLALINTAVNDFIINCNIAPPDGTQLHYVIFKLPPHVATSINSSAPSPSSDSLQTGK